MATVKDPITQQTGDIGSQSQTAFNTDVLGAQARAQRIADKTASTTANIVNRAPVVPTAINPADLTPQSPVTVPTISTPTTTSSVAGSTQSLIERMVANRELEATKAAKQSEDEYKATFDQITGVQESVGKVQDELQVNEKEATKDKLLGDLEASQRAQTNALRALDSVNLSPEQKAAQSQEINRKYSFEQADKALLYEVANRDFARAAEQADRKIALQLEPLKMKLDFQSKFYEVNQNKLSDAQKNTLNALITRGDREYKAEEERLKTLEDTRLKVMFEAQKNGADQFTLSQIQNAKTPEEAIVAGGEFVGAQQRFENELKLMQYGIDQAKLQQELSNTGLDTQLVDAYVREYTATGKVPTGMPKEAFGVVSEIARNAPKQAGTVIDATTGVKSSSVPATTQDDFARLYNITKMIDRLEKELPSGSPLEAALGAITGSTTAYKSTRKAIVDEIARMQTGAALTKEEQEFYEGYLPGVINNPFTAGKKIDEFRRLMSEKLNNGLSNYGLQIAGYGEAVDKAMYNNIEEYINSSPSNLNKVKQLRQQFPNYTEDQYMQILQPTSFNTVGGDTNQASMIKDGSRVQTGLWRGIATGIEEGSKFWKYGLDIALDGGKQAKVTAPFSGTVVSAKNDGAWGNSVKVKLDDGRIVRLSHLNNIAVKPGQKITTGSYVGNQGNTGKTYGKTGVHLDVTMYKPDGKPYTSREVASILGTKLA